MPESKDTDWDWEDFYHRNNDELVATWGNLANRVLAFAYKNFEGKIPEPGPLTDEDEALLKQVEDGFQSVAQEMEAVHLRAALGEAMRLATEVNRYLDITAPWQAIKTDRVAAARSVYTAIRAIDSLKMLLAPFLPFTSEKLHVFLGYTQPLFGTQDTARVKDALGEHSILRYHAGSASGRVGSQPDRSGTGAGSAGSAVQEAGYQDRGRRARPPGQAQRMILIKINQPPSRSRRRLVLI